MKVNVPHIAKLANLSITPVEEKILEKQLSEVLDYIKNLDEVDTKNIEPTSQVTGLENVSREDLASESLLQEAVLSNTQKKENGFFKVKAILEND